MKLDEALDILEKCGYDINEDFGIGVGGPCGLDQGIPHGGDGKGCCPQRMGLLYQRSPYSVNPLFAGVPAAHHPGYWLNQIPKKKKKKKKKKKHRLSESLTAEIADKLETFAWTIYKKLFIKKDSQLYKADEFELYSDFDKGFTSDSHSTHRAAAAGHFLGIITKNFLREYSMLDDDASNGDVKALFSKYLKQFKKEISSPWYKDDRTWSETI